MNNPGFASNIFKYTFLLHMQYETNELQNAILTVFIMIHAKIMPKLMSHS
jgi:hypothetical protein